MTTEYMPPLSELPPPALTDVSGGPQFDPRVLADAMRAQGQDDMAAEMGSMLPDDPDRVCSLTGHVALGYAFVPGTNRPLSHGRYEVRPTPYQRYQRGERPAARVATAGAYLDLRMSRTDNGAAQGAEAIVALLGLAEHAAQVEFDFVGDDVVIRRRPA